MLKSKYFLIIFLLVMLLSGCQKIKELSAEEYVDQVYNFIIKNEKQSIGIDLRDLESQYALGHIKGFINYNYQKGSKAEFITFMLSMYNKKTSIFLIDDSGQYVTEVVSLLRKEGYQEIYYYLHGYEKIKDVAEEKLYIVTGIDDCGC